MKRILTFLLMVSSVVGMAQQKIYLIVDSSKNTEESGVDHLTLTPDEWPLDWIVDKSYVLESGKLLAVPSRKINFVTY